MGEDYFNWKHWCCDCVAHKAALPEDVCISYRRKDNHEPISCFEVRYDILKDRPECPMYRALPEKEAAEYYYCEHVVPQ